jgi:hypothetical protein
MKSVSATMLATLGTLNTLSTSTLTTLLYKRGWRGERRTPGRRTPPTGVLRLPQPSQRVASTRSINPYSAPSAADIK